MLSLWRTGARLEPALSDASVERFDGYDVDGELRLAMRSWYLELLNHGSLELVPVTDISSRVNVKAGHAEGEWTVTLPPDVARVVSLAVDGFGPVGLIDADSEDNNRAIEALANRFVRLGAVPKAVFRPRCRQVTVYARQQPSIASLRAVVIPEDDTYILDESALGLIGEAARALY